jgi:pimeloyl-ACP methyl ester carboxylesterase
VGDSIGQPGVPRDISIETEGGRMLGVRLAGAPEGPLVVYMHGSPSSRLDIDAVHEPSARRGVTLAGVDRPGYGRSDPIAFTFETIASDVAAVADALGAERFAVFGQSTGVAHAVAVAALLPDRVTALATAGGSAPFEPGTKRWERLSEIERRGVALVGVDDAEAERLLAEPDKAFVALLDLPDDEIAASWAKMAGPADQRVLQAGFGELLPRSFREALRQGQGGWARDNVVWMANWAFDRAAIRCPATFWIGEQDKGNVEGGEWLASEVPHGTLRLIPDAGHFVAFERWDEVLDSLAVGVA